MTLLRTIKNLTPLSTRRYLKDLLPQAVVAIVGTPTGSRQGQSAKLDSRTTRLKPVRRECPVCGTSLPAAEGQAPAKCTGCGSLPGHRRLALAVYASLEDTDLHVLVLGSNPTLRSTVDGMGNITYARDLGTVPPELHSKIDLCIHSHSHPMNLRAFKAVLKGVDALLSPRGRQIFTLDASFGIGAMLNWQWKGTAVMDWLQRNGWPHGHLFEIEKSYGPSAADVFCCPATESIRDAILILPKEA